MHSGTVADKDDSSLTPGRGIRQQTKTDVTIKNSNNIADIS